MAINKVDGTLLESNLLRNGVNLAIETSLLYIDVINGRIGVKNALPSVEFDLTGSAAISGNLTVTGTLTAPNFSLTGVVALPSGGTNSIIYTNSLGDLTGSINLGYNDVTNTITATGTLTVSQVSISAAQILSNTAGLTIATTANGNLTITVGTGLINMSGNTGSMVVPTGTTLQQPTSILPGQVRWNTTTAFLEFYDGGVWQSTASKAYVDGQIATGFTIADQYAHTTVISGGNTLTVNGTANEVIVTAGQGTDILTFGLATNVTIPNTLTANGLASLNGGIAVNSTAFTVAVTTGNTAIAGTLGVTGASTLTTLGTSGLATLSSLAVSTTSTFTGLLTANGGISASTLTTSGNVTVGGNLTVNGTTTTVNSSTLSVADLNITVANGATTLAATNGAGLTFGAYITPPTFTYASASNTLVAGNVAGVTATNFYGQATTALYADLAEMYTADANILPGTVVCFGGVAEVTTCMTDMDTRVAGIVSTNPAYLMNSALNGVPVALSGRVPCRVSGTIKKGDMMVSDGLGGARAEANPVYGSVIGKALEDSVGDAIIEVVVGRV